MRSLAVESAPGSLEFAGLGASPINDGIDSGHKIAAQASQLVLNPRRNLSIDRAAHETIALKVSKGLSQDLLSDTVNGS